MKKVLSALLSFAMLLSVFGVFPLSAGAASMADSTFFAKFNYADYHALADVKAAADAGDYSSAKEELVNYFVERKAKGEVSAFDITQADENYGMAVLPLDNILTGPYEFDVWLNRFTVTSKDYSEYSVDLTEKTAAELDNQAISVMLFERQKQAFPVIVASKEMSGYEPVLVVETAEGDTYNIKPDNDTYIHSGNTSATYGSEQELYVKEQSDSASSPFGSQTRRAYINFPLTEAANKIVTKATLKLYAKLSSDCTLDSLDVHVISVGDTLWAEDTLCWSKIGGNIYSYQSAAVPTWQKPNGADNEYLNVTARFWYARAMAYEYLTYLEDPTAYAETHPLYPDGSVFGEKLIELMDAFASQASYGFNRTLETGERLNRWVDVLDALVDTPAVRNNPDKFCNILSFIWGDCNYLNGLSIADGGPWWSNWRIVANAGFFKAVEYIPEFGSYSAWRSKVEGNVEYTLDLLYNDDMSFTEAGPAYAVWCVQLFGDCARMAELNNHPMSKTFTEKLRYAARNAAESIYPDGYDSNIGDSNYRDRMPIFKDLNDFYNNDSILSAFANGSDEGAEYFTSIYDSVNTAYMRNSWNPDEAVYMQFNNNPNDGHCHPDSNQVLMYAYGKPLLVDSGRYSYSSFNSIYNDLRYASAHNTVEAVGVSLGNHSSSANPFSYTASNSTFDFETSMQNGYSGVEHTRNVTFLKEGFGIVTDFVDGSNSAQEYRQNWHFMPSSNAEMDGLTAKTDFYKEANITIVSASADSAQIRDGYHSADYGLVAASKYASYSKKGADVKFDTVLYPTKAGESASVGVTDLAEGDNSKAALEITVNGRKLYYYVKNTDASDGKINASSTDAKMLLTNEDGSYVAMVGGKVLDGVIESKNNIKSIVLEKNGDTLSIEGENLAPSTNAEDAIAIHVSGINAVILNGEAIDFTDENGVICAVRSTDITGNGDISVNGNEYKITGTENLITNGDFSNGTAGWSNASNGQDIAITPTTANAHGDSLSITNTASAGGSAASTLRRFVEVEGGKSYYLSYYVYATKATGHGPMSAAVLTNGGPVYGSFNNISFYNYNIYGGMNSWSAETNTQIGGSISRSDNANAAGMNHKEFIFTVPEGATHLMLSYFAWTDPGVLYLSDFSLCEVEKLAGEDQATLTALFLDENGNEIAPGVTETAEENTVYIYDAPESVKFNDGYYVLDEDASLLSTKIAKGENMVTAVYKKTGLVTVKYVNLDGMEISAQAEYEATVGSEFDGAEKARTNIVYNSAAYNFVPSSTDKIIVSDKISENTVTLYYHASGEEFDGLLALFTFDDEETGFSSEFAKAKSAGANSLSTDAMKGKSLYLNGTGSNYLSVTDSDGASLLTGLEELTVTFYAKVTAAGTAWSVFLAPNANAQSYLNEHYIGMLHSGSNITVERYNNSGSRAPALTAATAINEWKKYALVITENATTLYVDGKATTLSSSYKLSDILGDNSVFQIGKANWNSGEFFTGYIDELAIYNRALTEQEINAASMESKVTVNYVDLNGAKLLDETTFSLLSGAELTEAMIGCDKLIEVGGISYMIDSIDGIGSVGDGSDITVTVKYVEAVVNEVTFKATKGDSLSTGTTSTTGFASETGSDYVARLQTDHRWYYRAGLVGFDAALPENEEIVSAVVKLHINGSNGTTGPAIYSASSLPSTWARGEVSGFDLPEEAIAKGTVSGAYVEFDVSDYVRSEKAFDFAMFTTTNQEYIIYDSENTSYVPELILKTASPKTTRFEIVGGSAVYTSFDGENATVIVAYYNADGQMIKVSSASGNGNTVSVPIDNTIDNTIEGAVSYKAFVWSSASSLKPIFNPITENIE